jgi:hypothetical protein
LADPELAITVQHDGSTGEIIGSINSIDTADDELHGNCEEYYWFVAESSGFPVSVIWSTFASGNAGGSSLPPSGTPGPAWDLTTNFPGYNFVDDKLYVIGMYTPECGCYDAGFTYQLTFNTNSSQQMSQETEDAIIDAILNGVNGDLLGDGFDITPRAQEIILFPNPVGDTFNIQLTNDTIEEVEVVDYNGRKVFGKGADGTKNQESFILDQLAAGVYFVRVQGTIKGLYTTQLIKK